VNQIKIGIVCYPTFGGSGVVATELGKALAKEGHQVHFITYSQPTRLDFLNENLFYHEVNIRSYPLFEYAPYELALASKMVSVVKNEKLDLLHVHYAIPHASAAYMAKQILKTEGIHIPVVTTLHGTDSTLLGCDPGYGPAIHHALTQSDAVTTVSEFLKQETQRVLGFDGHMDVIHNFFEPRKTKRTREEVRRELGVNDEVLLFHSSNLRPVKRIDLLLETIARIRPRESFKLLLLAGESFAPFVSEMKRLGLEQRLIIREKVSAMEDYLQAADIGLFTSETESFCLGILEGMCFECPSVATRVGGIPEVMEDQVSGRFAPAGDAEALARATEELIQNRSLRESMGKAAQQRAREKFSAQAIVPKYEALYARVCQ